MTITYKQHRSNNLFKIKHQLQSLCGSDLIILQRQSGQTYGNPIRATLEKVGKDFVVCRHKSGRRECFNYVDFCSGELIFDEVMC